MSSAQVHTLRACSLLVIPPPPDRMPTQVGFPTDLSWAGWTRPLGHCASCARACLSATALTCMDLLSVRKLYLLLQKYTVDI